MAWEKKHIRASGAPDHLPPKPNSLGRPSLGRQTGALTLALCALIGDRPTAI